MLKGFINRLFQPIDIAPLVFFRIGFGALMLWEVWRYFEYDRIARYYIEPDFFFYYYGFDWLRPLPGDGMFLLFHGLGLLAAAIMLGLFYRLSMAVFWLCFTYVFLLDQAQYLNHFYLISLVSFLMIFIPAHRALSVDAWLRPNLRSHVAPAWALWLLRGQMAVVYVFGGLAKINPDWLVGEPLRMWMADRTDFPLIGGLFTEAWMVMLFSYGGLLFDLLIVPLLLWWRTRILALGVSFFFHLTNANLFNIGIFPYFAIAATLIFLPPHWFRLGRIPPLASDTAPPLPHTSNRRLILAGFGLYFAIQIALPLRHWLYPGDPSWTEEGHTLASHMRLRDKQGDSLLFASDPRTGTTWQVPIEEYLTVRQHDQMVSDTHMILRFSHEIARRHRAETGISVQVRSWSMLSLNGRAPQLMIDPTADLASAPDHLLAADWILPLVQQPFPHDPVPALLISRRFPGVLAIVNVTELIYPLEQFNLRVEDAHLNGTDFGILELMPGECLMAQAEETAELDGVFIPCNITGSQITVDPRLLNLDETLQIWTGTTEQRCRGIVCVVTHDATGAETDA
jgi:vitamin K-dependent gamma-carboxylase